MSKTARDVIAQIAPEPEIDPAYFIGLEDADKIVAALDAAGFVIVPKEPTEAMIAAGAEVDAWVFQEGQQPQPQIYRAMIAAASSTEKERTMTAQPDDTDTNPS